MRFLLTTDGGIEDLAAQEVRERWPLASAEPLAFGRQGRVRVTIEGSAARDELRELTTIHHAIELRCEAEVGSLAEVEGLLDRASFPELEAARSFRVTSERSKDLAFEPLALERSAGAALKRRYGTAVDLEGYEVNVRVDLYGSQLVAGIQLTRDSLSKRLVRARALRASLKPTLAAAMVRLAGAHREAGRLLDPCCGAGTIPIEAKRANPALEVVGSDWDALTVDTARLTVSRQRLEIEIREDDARTFDPSRTGCFDFIVTDPPYGVRVGRRADLTSLYSALLTSFERVLAPRGRIVVLVLRRRAFARALEPLPLVVVHERLVEAGGLTPRMLVLERQGSGLTFQHDRGQVVQPVPVLECET